MLSTGIELITLQQAGIIEEIPEPFNTLEQNALAKARYVNQITGKDCFADDTGLEVEALDGAPGVMSARFAGEAKNSIANMEKLLEVMQNETNRKARFRTIIALIYNNKEYLFEGIVEGEITYAPRGSQGFGYDPVFIPSGYSQTFAQMPVDEKNLISHRKNAIRKLVDFLDRV